MAKKPRLPGIPLGTTVEVFVIEETTVSVQLSEVGSGTWLDLEYDDEEHGRQAWQTLREQFEDSTNTVASDLRREYSVANMLSFLAAYLPRDGFCGATAVALVRIDAQGLRCQLPTGEWVSVHRENVLQSTASWRSEESDGTLVDVAVKSVYRQFQLPLGQTHERWSPIYLPADLCHFLDG